MSVSPSASRMSKEKVAVFTFGRFQPPTVGHRHLLSEVVRIAEEKKGNAYAFVSASMNDNDKLKNTIIKKSNGTKSKKRKVEESDIAVPTSDMIGDLVKRFPNPLSCKEKKDYMDIMFKDLELKIHTADVFKYKNENYEINSSIFSIVYILKTVLSYKKIYFVVGSDRKESFQRMFGKDNTVEVIGVDRNEVSTDIITGMSGTKMRTAALQDNFEFFKQGVSGLTDKDALGLMNAIREAYKFPPSQTVLSQGGYKKKVAKPKPKKKNRKVKTTNIMDLFRNLFVGPKKQQQRVNKVKKNNHKRFLKV
jgi:nicotinic acid mononucleotide adenylyltransferase